MRRSVLLLLLLGSAAGALAQSDTAAFRAALAVLNSPGKISALEGFLGHFPQSPFRGGAYNALFGLYLEGGRETDALDAASRSLQTIPPEARISPYNAYAYALAEKNVGLDSALAFATRAEVMLKAGGGGGMLAAVQDTRAFVLFRKGDAAAAEKLQQEAIRSHEDDPEYVGHLALYQEGNGKRREALSTLARAIYMGGDREMQDRFVEFLGREEKDAERREALKTSVVMGTVHAFIDTLHGERAIAAGSTAAAFMAAFSVDLPRAQELAEAATRSLTRKSPVEDAVTFRQNLALVAAARGRTQEALEMLTAIEDLVSPWSTDYWIALGGIYRKLGRPEDAINAYMNGLTVMNPPGLRDTLVAVYRTVHGSTDGLDASLDQVKQSGASFDPGKYSPGAESTGKVILAELFTGTECGPCVAADGAFDALAERYPAAKVAILEYHVHIPGPDPLTTNASWSRYKLYGARGTPTAVIDGREKIVGGGPKFITRNRYNLYRSTIEKYVGDAPGADLTIDVARRHDSVSVAAHVGEAGGHSANGKPVLHVALVERSVDYIGGNGVARQAMVVRSLFGGPEGTLLSNPGHEETVRLTEDIARVEADIRAMLADPKSQPSWPGRTRTFGGWRARPEKVERSNLLVVAWIQDAVSNEVLQAICRDVPSGMSSN